MTVRENFAGTFSLALAVALSGGCGQESSLPATPGDPGATAPQFETAPARPLTVFDTGGALAITPVMEAWRAEGGARFAIAESDYSTPFPENTDLLVAGSLARLWTFAEEDKLRPVYSQEIDGRIDERFRDSEARWVGLSYRARVVVFNPAVVSDSELASIDTYASLGDDVWHERLCLSSSRVDGNRLLVAWLIRRHGEREAELIVRRWRANLRDGLVEASDEAVINKIDNGECGVGLIDSDIAALLPQSGNISVLWFDDPASTMLDITGAGVSRHAANPDAAAELLGWLTTEGASAFFAASRNEFPANAAAATSNALAAWSANAEVSVSVADLGFLLEDAERLIERAGYP